MNSEGCMYVLGKNPMLSGVWTGGRNSVLWGCMYAATGVGLIPGGYVWFVNVDLVPSGCIELIGV